MLDFLMLPVAGLLTLAVVLATVLYRHCVRPVVGDGEAASPAVYRQRLAVYREATAQRRVSRYVWAYLRLFPYLSGFILLATVLIAVLSPKYS